jgi:hypothetical protein
LHLGFEGSSDKPSLKIKSEYHGYGLIGVFACPGHCVGTAWLQSHHAGHSTKKGSLFAPSIVCQHARCQMIYPTDGNTQNIFWVELVFLNLYMTGDVHKFCKEAA